MHQIHLFFYIDPVQAISSEGKDKIVMDNSINLEVKIANSSLLHTFMNRLVWYYNEYPIFSSNIDSLERNKSFNASFKNGGEYRVRYEGFMIVPNNIKCERDLLDALQYYPTFQPVVFNARKQGNFSL